jgi:hypothetical protein
VREEGRERRERRATVLNVKLPALVARAAAA